MSITSAPKNKHQHKSYSYRKLGLNYSDSIATRTSVCSCTKSKLSTHDREERYSDRVVCMGNINYVQLLPFKHITPRPGLHTEGLQILRCSCSWFRKKKKRTRQVRTETLHIGPWRLEPRSWGPSVAVTCHCHSDEHHVVFKPAFFTALDGGCIP